jgi:hypothetical protein
MPVSLHKQAGHQEPRLLATGLIWGLGVVAGRASPALAVAG